METEVPIRQKSYLIPLIITLILVLVGAAFFYLKTTYPFLFAGLSQKVSTALSTPSPSPQATSSLGEAALPTPIPYVLPTGSQIYHYSHGSEVKGPKIQTVTIDPIDPQPGTTQTLTLEIESVSPMTKNALTIATDNHTTSLELTRISGDNLKGTYAVTWTPTDTYEHTYSLRFKLESTTDAFDSTMYLRP